MSWPPEGNLNTRIHGLGNFGRVKFSIRFLSFFFDGTGFWGKTLTQEYSFISFQFPDCWELSQYDLGVTMSVLFACRVLVCNRWLYMENSALSKVVGSLIPWFVPFWAVRREGRKVTYAQGMSRHSPDEVQADRPAGSQCHQGLSGYVALWV